MAWLFHSSTSRSKIYQVINVAVSPPKLTAIFSKNVKKRNYMHRYFQNRPIRFDTVSLKTVAFSGEDLDIFKEGKHSCECSCVDSERFAFYGCQRNPFKILEDFQCELRTSQGVNSVQIGIVPIVLGSDSEVRPINIVFCCNTKWIFHRIFPSKATTFV